jgi:hypothetical protein
VIVLTLPLATDRLRPGHCTSSVEPAELHDRLLRAWQLAVLRFAVTLDVSDSLNVRALAAELDGRSKKRDASFHFFHRTSVELCAAILGSREEPNAIVLRFHAEIENPRLKRAFAAAAGIAQAEPAPVKRRAKQDDNLFKGLPSRKAAHA